MKYPAPGCRKAYECGQELYLSGRRITPEMMIDEAMRLCDTQEERVYFYMALFAEATDLEEAVNP